MPFPPSFDHVWDLTQPPDTQLASLGAQDFRNLKDDVMQRFSLLSGTLANRPTPETVNATWGGAGFGLIYLATDTDQFFQWSGAAWTDISSSFGIGTKFVDSSVQSGLVGSGSLNTVTIPGGTLKVGSIVDIFARILVTGNSVTISKNLDFNGNHIVATTPGNQVSGDFLLLEAIVYVLGATSEKTGGTVFFRTGLVDQTPLSLQLSLTEIIANPITIASTAGDRTNLTGDLLIARVRF